MRIFHRSKHPFFFMDFDQIEGFSVRPHIHNNPAIQLWNRASHQPETLLNSLLFLRRAARSIWGWKSSRIGAELLWDDTGLHSLQSNSLYVSFLFFTSFEEVHNRIDQGGRNKAEKKFISTESSLWNRLEYGLAQ